jgi:hypothetical protein
MDQFLSFAFSKDLVYAKQALYHWAIPQPKWCWLF